MTNKPRPTAAAPAVDVPTATILKFPKRRHAGTSSAGTGSTMPQRAMGAAYPLAFKADCITTNVSAGKRTKPRQLKAAPYERPVSFATADTPPSASITSAVVDSSRSNSSMESANNPTFLDSQHPSIIDTKKFGFPASFSCMSNAGTDSAADVALRCRALVRLYGRDEAGEPNAKWFAEQVIGISDTRWGNILKSGALSRDVARQIYLALPEITLDWLYRGRDDGMTRVLGAELLAAYRAVLAERRSRPKGRAA